MFKSNTFVNILAAILLGFVDAVAYAQQQPMPISIEADDAELSQRDGMSTYTGDVVLTRGGLTLTGNKLVVSRIDSDGSIRAELTGAPTTLDRQAQGADSERVTGHADRMVYTNSDATLVLRGDAVVERGGDVIRGQVIRHHLDSERTVAESGPGGDGRVHITIQPDDQPDDNTGPAADP